MSNVGTYAISLDTPIHLLTPRQLFEMQDEWLSKRQKSQESAPSRWYVNTIEELAKILGTSKSTLYRMKTQGLLDNAISQSGKWMVIDVDKVIETFRLSNRRNKKRIG